MAARHSEVEPDELAYRQIEKKHGFLRTRKAVMIAVDPEKNEAHSAGVREIQTDGASVKVLVIPTDEELEIVEETVGWQRRPKSRIRTPVLAART